VVERFEWKTFFLRILLLNKGTPKTWRVGAAAFVNDSGIRVWGRFVGVEGGVFGVDNGWKEGIVSTVVQGVERRGQEELAGCEEV
jgi:hypothetical protein